MEVRITDNCSTDGSWNYLQKLNLGLVKQEPRLEIEPQWLATTFNNMRNLRQILLSSDKDYIWNIENDCFFYNPDSLDKALEVLMTNKDISLVHLRKYTRMDALDSPGVPRNMSRVSEVRTAPSGFEFFLKQKRPEYVLWIPVNDELGTDFSPDKEPGYGKCPMGKEAIGAVRLGKLGYERLLTEYWNSYVSDGWLARIADLRFLIKKYDPIGERQTAIAFKRHFMSAKLDEDGFVCFGWKARVHPTEEQIKEVFTNVKLGEYKNSEYLRLNPNDPAGNINIDETKLDVYRK